MPSLSFCGQGNSEKMRSVCRGEIHLSRRVQQEMGAPAIKGMDLVVRPERKGNRRAMKKLLSIAILSVSAVMLSTQEASAWWPFNCCAPCYMKVQCRQYNAFSPFCCDTACFSGCGFGNGPQPIPPWNQGYL